MNRLYKVIWNYTKQAWVAVSELGKARGKENKSNVRKKRYVPAISLTLAIGTGVMYLPAAAAAVFWAGGTGNWTTPSNWSTSSVPTTSDYAYVNTGTAQVSAVTANVGDTYVSSSINASAPANASIEISNGGQLNSGNAFIASDANYSGTVTVTGSGSSWSTAQLQIGLGGRERLIF